MVKISKNAKKILALTLAGVMTVGTVVPGSALSTVENVQAETTQTVESVFADVQTAFENLYNTAPVVITGDAYDVETDLKNALEWDQKYAGKGFSLTVNENSYFVANCAKSVTVTVSKDGETPKTATWNVPKTYMTASDIAKTYLGANSKNEIDLSSVAVTPEMTDAAVKKAVEKYVADQLVVFSRTGDYSTTVNAKSTIANNVKTWAVDVTLANKKSPADSQKVTGTIKVDVPSEDSDAKKAADLLANSFNSLTVDGLDINLGTKDLDKINKEIENEAKAIVGDSFTTINSITASNAEIIENGVWKGILTVTDNKNNSVKVTLTIRLSNKEDEKNLPVKFELVKPVTEITVGSGIQTLADSMKVTFEDGSSKTVGSDAFADNEYFTYDKAAFDTSKLGKVTVEFFGKNSETQARTSITVDVVTNTAYDSKKFGNVQANDASAVISSDDTVLVPVFNEKGIITNFKALKAGKVTVTVVKKDGTTYNTEVTVDEKGTLTYGPAVLAKTDRYVSNTASNLGFVANKISVKQEPTNWRDDTVANAELTTIGDQKVVKITPVANGTATITLTGGLNGKLQTTIVVNVKDSSVTVNPKVYSKVDSIALNNDALNTIKNQKFELPAGVTKKEIAVNSLGFSSEDEIVLYDASSPKKELDTVYASDADKAELRSSRNRLYLDIKYGSKTATVDVTDVSFVGQKKDNTVTELGLIASNIKNIENTDSVYKNSNLVNAEIITNENGKSEIVVTPGTDISDVKGTTTVTITVEDKLGNVAKITATVTNGVITKLVTSEKFNGYQGYTLTAPAKTMYTIGEKADLTGAYLVSKDKKTKVALTEEMLEDFSTAKSTVKEDDAGLDKNTVKVSYGGVNKSFDIKVKPAVATVNVSSLGLASGETVVSVANRGDVSINSKLAADKNSIEIVAKEVSKSGAAIVTTNKGNTLAVKITVDENGVISTDVAETFVSSIAIVDNTEAVLGMTGVTVESSDVNIVAASLAGNKVVLTSVNPGTATVSVKDGDKVAKINVTVDEFGTITTEVVKYQKYTPGWHAAENGGWFWVEEDGTIKENGWVDDNGVRYYIENGVTVYNTWKFFESEGVWRYFNKWGANVENGWYWVGKFCYFFRDGQMVENEWIKTNGIWSYVDKYGHALQNGWFKIDGKYYCFDKYGNMYADTYVGKYYVNKWGAWDSRYDKK